MNIEQLPMPRCWLTAKAFKMELTLKHIALLVVFLHLVASQSTTGKVTTWKVQNKSRLAPLKVSEFTNWLALWNLWGHFIWNFLVFFLSFNNICLVFRYGDWNQADIEILNKHLFITAKSMIYLVNLSEKDFIRKKNKWLLQDLILKEKKIMKMK